MTIRNDNRLSDYLSASKKLAGDKAAGGDAWPKMIVLTVSAAADGVVSPDDAEMIVNTFIEAQGKKSVHDRTTDSVKKTKSEIKKTIEFGALTTVDAVDVIGRAVTIYGNMQVDRKSAVNAYLQVVRNQLKSPDYALTDDEIEAAMAKDEAKARTIEQQLKAALKAVEAAIKLNEESDTPIALEGATAAKSALEAQIATLARAAEIAKARAHLASLGVAA
jgi:hypothetical protein